VLLVHDIFRFHWFSSLCVYLLIDLFNQELFHGPTFAFKDVALQMLGNFFEYFLSTGSNGGRLAVLGATSGDTGSAAI
jgi:threonine synthase